MTTEVADVATPSSLRKRRPDQQATPVSKTSNKTKAAKQSSSKKAKTDKPKVVSKVGKQLTFSQESAEDNGPPTNVPVSQNDSE